ncbi:hypothetical protein BD311DRAFT_659275 [Dichomitus squalens]|uniref:Uncharacterized protein n=1 Tax=Dichomitus squalens TaxID=114155 RepID=A0A4Q9MR87_9APHY|nr:hypothetical protein BD311DRAFT_659275 [Dichomitus squalens]
MRTSFVALACAVFGAVTTVVAQGSPELITPITESVIGLHPFVEYKRPGHVVSEDTVVEVFLHNATVTAQLLPHPTFSPGNGPQDTANGTVNIDPTVFSEGTYGEIPLHVVAHVPFAKAYRSSVPLSDFTVKEISPFKGTVANIGIVVTLSYDA